MISLINKKFDKLQVIKLHHKDKRNRLYYICKCDCGMITKPIRNDSLTLGIKKSCGAGLCSNHILNIIGKKFGKLLVINFSHLDHQGKARWICKCDCGIITKPLSSDNLIRNEISSCGNTLCHGLTKSLMGKKFGKLIVNDLDNSKNINGQLYWMCKCECGSIKSINGQSLKNGKTISCGNGFCNGMADNLINKKFGTLTVIEYCDKIANKLYWKCKCDCGSIIDYCRSDVIKNHKNKLCQCNRFSGEKLLTSILQQIYDNFYIKRHYIPDFLKPQHVDGCLFDKNTNKPFLAFEYDGEQHFKPVRFGGIGKKEATKLFEYTKNLDMKKNIKMRENKDKIPFFIRIPFDYEITIDNIKNILIKNKIPLTQIGIGLI